MERTRNALVLENAHLEGEESDGKITIRYLRRYVVSMEGVWNWLMIVNVGRL
jgi:hypothetical protein